MRFEHQPALDGLRGIALAAVLLFHADLGWLAGGFHGMDVFFVLSGFLITTLLLAESGTAGSISLSAFWSRRIRRLLPALLAMMMFVCVYALTIAAPTELGRIRRDGISTLLYVSNWAQIADKVGYFESFGVRSPLLHTWSLAVEEQYYLLWPLLVAAVVWAAMRRNSGTRAGARGHIRSRRRVAVIAGVGAVTSAAWMAWLAPRAGIDRVYYGTDTRGMALLVGSGLAAVWWGRWSAAPPRWARWAGWAGAALLLTSSFHRWNDAILTRGGYLVLALAAAGVIMAVASPAGGLLGRALSWAPLRRLGIISYGVYLWHWPLNIIVSTDRTGWPFATVTIIRLVGALALGELSYRLIEHPLRRTIHWPVALAPMSTVVLLAAVLASTTGAQITNDQRFAAERAASAEPPPVSTAPAPPPTKVLVLGDSLAASFADTWTSSDTLIVQSAAWSNCGRATAGPLPGAPDGPPRSAGTPAPCGAWQKDWPQAVADAQPDVVIVAARAWQPMSSTPALRAPVTMDVSQTDRALLDELEAVRDITAASGAVTMLGYLPPGTASGETPYDTVWENGATGFASTRADDVRAIDLFAAGSADVGAAPSPPITLVDGPAGQVIDVDSASVLRTQLGAAARAWHLDRWADAGGAASRVPTLLVGDSVGWSLGSFWYGDSAAANERSDGVQLWNRAQYFCELDSGPRVVNGRTQSLSTTCANWREEWRSYVERFSPRLVLVVLGNWEVSDRRINGKLLRFGSPEHDAYFGTLLDELVGVLSGDGATVVFASAFPVLATGTSAAATGTDPADPARFDHLNGLLDAAAERHTNARVVDVASRVCPTRPCPSTVDGVELRPDGTHFGPAGGLFVASYLEPQLLEIAR